MKVLYLLFLLLILSMLGCGNNTQTVIKTITVEPQVSTKTITEIPSVKTVTATQIIYMPVEPPAQQTIALPYHLQPTMAQTITKTQFITIIQPYYPPPQIPPQIIQPPVIITITVTNPQIVQPPYTITKTVIVTEHQVPTIAR